MYSGPAPWSAQFESDISQMSSPEFVLATLAETSGSWAPRARYCIYRGMWARLAPNSKNSASLNPAAWASDLPTFTTDARMQKAAQLYASGATADADVRREGHEAGSESGGGGPVEAVWWIKEGDVMAQWRVRGAAWVLGRDVEAEHSAANKTRNAVKAHMRDGDEADKQTSWSWSKEVTAHFGNISPGMRGTFKNPVPGAPKHGEPDDKHKLGQKVEDLDDEVARANFRVGVIVPDLVERVDLKDPEKAHRVLYTLADGKWTQQEEWP